MSSTMDLVLEPVRVATSKPARQTYLNTALFMITSSILFGFAVFAYILFYYNYVPQIGIDRVIHLQYGDGPHPYGITSLDGSLISQQSYDITLTLHVPRSPPNLQQGNFMLSLSLLTPTYKHLPRTASSSSSTSTDTSTLTTPSGAIYSLAQEDILFSSRRPALLTYSSRLISLSERILSLPLYILALKQESEILHIPMAESAFFSRGRKNIPGFAMLEIQSTGQEVQVYAAKIAFKARFQGLRWWMYNYRILAFVLGTMAFWVAEVVFTVLGWFVVRSYFETDGDVKKDVKGEVEGDGIKKEEDSEEVDLSDTPRTFPTYGRQAPLKYESSGREGPQAQVKDEDSEEYAALGRGVLAEADDEDEDDEEVGGFRGMTDSGIGTSFSEGGEKSGVKRRRSKGGRN